MVITILLNTYTYMYSNKNSIKIFCEINFPIDIFIQFLAIHSNNYVWSLSAH